MNWVDPTGYMEQNPDREGGLTPEERHTTCDLVSGGCSGPLCGATELDMGTITLRVTDIQNDDSYGDSGNKTSNFEKAMMGLEVANYGLRTAYWISPGLDSGLVGLVYAMGSGGDGIIVAGVGIDNNSHSDLQIVSVRLKIGDKGSWTPLSRYTPGLHSSSQGTAKPNTSTAIELKSLSIFPSRNFSVTISVRTVNSNVIMSGVQTSTWYYSR